MNYSYLYSTPDQALERVSGIKAAIFDFDGVFTDNTEAINSADGSVIKFRSHYDGQGISLLRDIGLRIAIATSAGGQFARPVELLAEKWNGGLPSSKRGVVNQWPPVKIITGAGHVDKASLVKSWLEEIGVSLGETAAMGDDLTDLPLLQMVGFSAAPRSAELIVREQVHFVSERNGGRGAIRDLANFILAAKGIDPRSLRLC